MKDGAPDAGMHTDKLFSTKQSWEEKGVSPVGLGLDSRISSPL
jgi:hypothetical protein